MAIAAPTAAARPYVLTANARRALGSEAFRWGIAPAVLAWAAFVFIAARGGGLAFCASLNAGALTVFGDALQANLARLDVGMTAVSWLLMLVAMMAPLLAPVIAYVAAKSFVDRRDRAIGLFVAGYTMVWFPVAAAGFLALLALGTLLVVMDPRLPAGVFGAACAALWQLSAAKRRALNRCHGAVPLRASGRAADIDSLKFGILHGSRCVRACAPTMFPAMAGAHGLATMAAVSLVLLAERAAPRPRQLGAAIVLVLSAMLAAPHLPAAPWLS